MTLQFNDTDVARIQTIKDRLDKFADELAAIAAKYPDCEDKRNAILAEATMRETDNILVSFT